MLRVSMRPRLKFALAVFALLSTLTGLSGLSLFPAASTQAASAPIYWGALVRGSQYGLPEPPDDMRAVAVFESHAGKKVSLVNFGQPWYTNGTAIAFPSQAFENVRLHGAIPFFSWSSRDSYLPLTNQPAFKNSAITGGAYDAFIRQFATDAKNWGHPFFLRFDWEMNGWWYPWSEGVDGTTGTIPNGNKVGEFVAMWRHVHDIFAQVGATNVTWVWCVNHLTKTSSGVPSLAQIYPGDNYVNWTGFDAYNRNSDWESFKTTATGAGTTWLLNTYQATVDVAPSKPLVLGEMGSKEDSVDSSRKADWLTDALLTQLPQNFPHIRAIVYFNWNTTSDPTSPDASMVIESSPHAQAAFAAGIGSAYYATNQFANLPAGIIAPLSLPAPAATPTRTPTPKPTAAPQTYASDSFSRTLTGSWGSADKGGVYTLSGNVAHFNTNGTTGTTKGSPVNSTYSAYLLNVSARDVNARVRISTDKVAQGGSEIAYIVLRHTGTNTSYLARVRFSGTDIRVQAMTEVNGTQTTLGGEKIVSGVTQASNQFLWLRAQVKGANPTTINLRLWADGKPEPTAWLYTITDTTSGLQSAGSVGLRAYLATSATNAPVTFKFDDFLVTSP